MGNPILSTARICKNYDGVTVLGDVDFDVHVGEIHALLGANGAGKSTLCNIIAGLNVASSGSMSLDGHAYAPSHKQTAEAAGVQIVQQELNLISSLSVAENILLTRLPSRFGIIHHPELHRRARTALDRLGLTEIQTQTIVESLGVGQQQMVEIAAALDQACRLLILDEPTAALSGRETDRLFEQLVRLRSEGVGIIYISHRLDEVAQLADRVTVLRDGKNVCTCPADSLSTDQLVNLMSGETMMLHDHRFESFARPQIALRANHFSRAPLVDDVSLTVHRGERLGIAGLVGSGRTELLRLIFGADVGTSGEVNLHDDARPYRFFHPSEAVRSGVAMVTEDRKRNGLLLSQSIRANTSLCALRRKFSHFGFVREAAERHAAREMVERLETRCSGIEQTVGTLSGGNQQKVAVSKWLVHDADIYFFDEPTRGIDVGARRRIYRLFHSLAESGKALVIVSSDLDELLGNCDRIVVMSNGKLAAEFTRAEWTRDKIMQAAFSGYLT